MGGIIHSMEVVNSVDEGPVKPMHLMGGTTCYWLKWDNDWLGS